LANARADSSLLRPSPPGSTASARSLAREVSTEANAIRAQSRLGVPRLGNARSSCRGWVVVTGIGKSGHIARKLAATLASTGTPILRPCRQASHGDLGMTPPRTS
jgi:arabinose-5-phosphate isomerase